MRKRRRKAERNLNAAKSVSIKGDHDDWEVCLPDWKYTGSYWIHVKHRKWAELVALRECVDELEEK